MALRPRRPLNRSEAWACLLANQLVLPGLGSLTAGRRSGYVQAVLALIGFGLSGYWCVWVVAQWIRTRQFPDELGPYFWTCLLGITLFAFAWSWAMASSVGIILSVSSESQLPPPVPPDHGPKA